MSGHKNDKLLINPARLREQFKKYSQKFYNSASDPDEIIRPDSQNNLAKILGVNKSLVSQWLNKDENKRLPVPLSRLRDIASLYGCEWEYLCGLSEYRTFQDQWDALAQKSEEEGYLEIGTPFASGNTITGCTVTAQKADIKALILAAAHAGAYPLIMDAIKELLEPIAPDSGYPEICEGLKKLDRYIEKN